MDTTWKSGLKQYVKRSSVLKKLIPLYGEVGFTMNIVRSGWVLIYQRNRALSRRLPGQKVMTLNVDLPPWRDFHDLRAWLDANAILYQEGAFCIYIPPQKEMNHLLGAAFSIYPPNCGLKMLKELKAPAAAKYVSRAVHPSTTRVSDWISYRPLDYLRVANYMYDQDIGPRVYDLLEIQTPHNRLSVYVMQHVAGTAPSEIECAAFIARLRELFEGQLVPLIPAWEPAKDFVCPDCQGNLLRDEMAGKLRYVDFQAFMMRDPQQHICQMADLFYQDGRRGRTRRHSGARHLCPSITGRDDGQWHADVDFFKQALQRQGVSVEGAVILDVGCDAGMVMHFALTGGATWAFGWERPPIAAAARKLLLALGMTRFDIFDLDLSGDRDLLADLPQDRHLGINSVLFFRAGDQDGAYFERIKTLPFKYMVYKSRKGAQPYQVKHDLAERVAGWGLEIVDVGAVTGSSGTHVMAVLRRDERLIASLSR